MAILLLNTGFFYFDIRFYPPFLCNTNFIFIIIYNLFLLLYLDRCKYLQITVLSAFKSLETKTV